MKGRLILMHKQQKENDTLYAGVDEWVNKRTGEIVVADQVIKKVPRNGFEITYLSYFVELFDKLGGKKYQVFKYILDNKSADNTLIITTRELAKKTKTSTKTVQETLNAMKEANLIEKRTGAIMLNPKIAHRGTKDKERFLLQRFEAFETDEDDES